MCIRDRLIYGLPDYARESFPRYDLSYAGGRPLFVTVGSMETVSYTHLDVYKRQALYKKCAEYALTRGIIIADTKFEFGLDEDGNVVLGAEMLLSLIHI